MKPAGSSERAEQFPRWDTNNDRRRLFEFESGRSNSEEPQSAFCLTGAETNLPVLLTASSILSCRCSEVSKCRSVWRPNPQSGRSVPWLYRFWWPQKWNYNWRKGRNWKTGTPALTECDDLLWSTNRTNAKPLKRLLLSRSSLSWSVVTTAKISRYPKMMKLKRGRLWNRNEERSSFWVPAFRNWPAWRLEGTSFKNR